MKIFDNVELLDLDGCNAYLILGEKNILIDTGLPKAKDDLINRLKAILGDSGSIDSVILTHHDVDHIGNLKAVQDLYGATAYIHPLDLPYATGETSRPGVKRMLEKVVGLQIADNIKTFDEFENNDIAVIHTPGHTPGHCIFKYGDCIFTGDLFKMIDNTVICMSKKMNFDNELLSKSINTLLDMDAKFLCPSHGDYIQYDDRVKAGLVEAAKRYKQS